MSDIDPADEFVLDYVGDSARQRTAAEVEDASTRAAALRRHLEAVAVKLLLHPFIAASRVTATKEETDDDVVDVGPRNTQLDPARIPPPLRWIADPVVAPRVLHHAVTGIIESGAVTFTQRLASAATDVASATRRTILIVAAALEASVIAEVPAAAQGPRLLDLLVSTATPWLASDASAIRKARASLFQHLRAASDRRAAGDTGASPTAETLIGAARSRPVGLDAAVAVVPVLLAHDGPLRTVLPPGARQSSWFVDDIAWTMATAAGIHHNELDARGDDEFRAAFLAVWSASPTELALAGIAAVLVAARGRDTGSLSHLTPVEDKTLVRDAVMETAAAFGCSRSAMMLITATLRDVRRFGGTRIPAGKHVPRSEAGVFTVDRNVDPDDVRAWETGRVARRAPVDPTARAPSFVDERTAAEYSKAVALTQSNARCWVVRRQGASAELVAGCSRCVCVSRGQQRMSRALAHHVTSGSTLQLVIASGLVDGFRASALGRVASLTGSTASDVSQHHPLRGAPIVEPHNRSCCAARHALPDMPRSAISALLCAAAAGWGDALVLHERVGLTSMSSARVVGALLRRPFTYRGPGRPRRERTGLEAAPGDGVVASDAFATVSAAVEAVELPDSDLTAEEERMYLNSSARREAISLSFAATGIETSASADASRSADVQPPDE